MNNAQRIENAIKWIDTLKTTRMKQAPNYLGDRKNGFCCLGLACHVLELEYDPTEGEQEVYVDPLGLFDSVGVASGAEESEECLAELNDGGWSFNKISKVLKDAPEKYFEPAVAEGIKKHYAEADRDNPRSAA